MLKVKPLTEIFIGSPETTSTTTTTVALRISIWR